MGFFKHVSENSPFVPSASMTNATVDILNAQRLPVPQPQALLNGKNQITVKIKNVSGVTILPFQPLILGNLLVLPDASNVPNGNFYFEANLPAQESDTAKRKLCIAVSPMDADEYGTAIITGLAVARVEKISADHQYVDWKGTSDDTLQTASSGIARILHKSDSWVVSETDSTLLMLLQLGTPAPASGGSYEYSGYFKLYLISETSGGTTTYKVRIADSATYQDETSVGGNSTASVNGTTFPIASYLSGALTANTLFYLKFDSAASTKVTLESSTNLTLPSDTDTTAYYQLGRFYTGTTPYIQQDHTSVSVNSSDGVARWYWVKNEC